MGPLFASTDPIRRGALLVLSVLAVTAGVPAQAPTDLAAQASKLPQLEPAARVTALRAIGDALLRCGDADERQRAIETLRRQADDGLFCSPSATEPSLLWFEFVRAMRRADVRAAGDGVPAITRTLGSLVDRRKELAGVAAAWQGQPADLHNLRSFGWHGSGEVLEAIAELAESHGEAARELGGTLAQFLSHEPIEPPAPHQEGGAGVGDTLPETLASQQFPILWADGYRIALARAVLATRPPGADLPTATLHLLYSQRRDDRLQAIARLRTAPIPEAAVPHLIHALGDGDRLVVRETILLLGAAGTIAAPARAALQQLADGADREWRTLAKRALQQIGDR